MKRSLIVLMVILILILLLLVFIKSVNPGSRVSQSNHGVIIYSPSPASSNQPNQSNQPGFEYPIPTRAPNNNLSLQQYLPYETSNFLLEYDPARNTYLFHFKFRNNTGVSLPDQFDKAKQDAINFIQSKGIDVNSLAIEWLYK